MPSQRLQMRTYHLGYWRFSRHPLKAISQDLEALLGSCPSSSNFKANVGLHSTDPQALYLPSFKTDKRTQVRDSSGLKQRPHLLAPGTCFIEDNFSTGCAGGWFQDDSRALHLLCTSFLLLMHQLQLRSSGIRSKKLGPLGLMDGRAYPSEARSWRKAQNVQQTLAGHGDSLCSQEEDVRS